MMTIRVDLLKHRDSTDLVMMTIRMPWTSSRGSHLRKHPMHLRSWSS
jgi:hypothetical protein